MVWWKCRYISSVHKYILIDTTQWGRLTTYRYRVLSSTQPPIHTAETFYISIYVIMTTKKTSNESSFKEFNRKICDVSLQTELNRTRIESLERDVKYMDFRYNLQRDISYTPNTDLSFWDIVAIVSLFILTSLWFWVAVQSIYNAIVW